MKKILALVLACCMVFALCAVSASADSKGSVYYLNFKPEADEAWQSLAKVYTEQTGVPVTVLTAASGSVSVHITLQFTTASKQSSENGRCSHSPFRILARTSKV